MFYYLLPIELYSCWYDKRTICCCFCCSCYILVVFTAHLFENSIDFISLKYCVSVFTIIRLFFARIKYYHMVKPIFIDLQKIKCSSLWSKLTDKRYEFFCSKSWYAKIKFLKIIHRKEFSRKKTYDIDLLLYI